ncbi:MAG: PAS domain S-box protein [Proteobacteria bacterium]|nr:PAS domain S-box protein [Pseudomonadota bacterium]
MKLSHEVLLALAYVSQISDPDSVRSRFIESLNELDKALTFEFVDHFPAGVTEYRVIPIATLRSSFGYAVMTENATALGDAQAVYRNAFKFLAIILENRMQARALESKNQSLLKEIKLEKSLVRTVLDTLPVGVWVADGDGTILMGNAANEKIGAGPNDFGKAWWSDTGKHIEPEDWGIARAIKAGETVIDQEIDTECSDGTHKAILHSAAPLLNDEKRVIGAVGVNQDITERKQAEDALRESEKKFKQIFETANVGKSLTSLTGELDVNKAFCDLLGYTPEELKRKTWQEITPPDDIESIQNQLNPLLKGEKDSARFNKRYIHKNGTYIWADISVAMRYDSEGKPVNFITTIVDITERKQAEDEKENLQAQLIQAQKMESVGRLAGGVAHDFNNMLSVIIGNTELAMDNISSNDPSYDALQEILKAARRSAEITRQLLAFARKQTIAPKVLDLNETVERILKMLRRLIGEDIDLAWLPGTKVWPVRMDPSQIDQILANLCVNARDAISGVGKITIETGTRTFDEAYCNDHAGFMPGDFNLLAISDDGSGMDSHTLNNLFEPFFTTKDVDKGTGLGLAMVYGIVKQNDGFINVYSETGQGTTFTIYLPRHNAPEEPTRKTTPVTADSMGSETILLVEDEQAILKMTAKMLDRLGYTVLTANSPEKAIEIAREYTGELHLLMTDVVMPLMNGRDLAQNILSLYPNLKQLFISGYTANVIVHRGVLDEGVHFIQKPFSVKNLGVKVRDILDQK